MTKRLRRLEHWEMQCDKCIGNPKSYFVELVATVDGNSTAEYCDGCGALRQTYPNETPDPSQLSLGPGSALKMQVDGDHYKKMKIQPIEYCQKNELNFCESNVIKYVSRHRFKNGARDIKKAIHNLELLLEMEYPDETR